MWNNWRITVNRGQMIPDELERLVVKSIGDGKIPFLVTATAGTTVFGAYDPINPIADICEKHHLWLHIDVSRLFFLDFLFSK